MKYLLGTDCGSTMTKAALFDLEGREIACAGRPLHVYTDHPGWREIDPEQVWQATAEAIREVVAKSGVNPADILALAPSGAGNGGYYLDEDGKPVRRAIQSSDSRTTELVKELRAAGVNEKVLALNGTAIGTNRTTVLALWIKRNEPENYARIRHVVWNKDYVKYRLTGQWVTDTTDAFSPGFVDLVSEQYSKPLFDAVDIGELYGTLPPFFDSWDIVGEVTPQAAAQTGLAAGTPVAAGMHDVFACTFGSGGITPGELIIVAGTWNINLLIVPRDMPLPPDRTMTILWRNAEPQVGFLGSSGATSAANLDWFIERCCGHELEEARAKGCSVYDLINAAVENLPPEGLDLIYHPFLNLHGAALPDEAKAGFYGLSGWHTKAHMLRALYEGVAFSHLQCIRQFPPTGYKIRAGHLTGGAAKSSVWSQMFADVLDMRIDVIEAQEVGSLGAALCAGIGAGVYKDPTDAVKKAVRIARTHTPNPDVQPTYARRYDVFNYLIDAMVEPWNRLSTLR